MATHNRLTSAELFRIWARFSFFSHTSSNPKGMQSNKWAHAMDILAKKYYGKDEKARMACLTRHTETYQDEPQTGQLIAGYITRLEEEVAIGQSDDIKTVTQMKKTLMEPVGSIGNTLVQKLIIPLLLILGIGLSTDGNWIGAVVYAVAVLAIGLGISYGCFVLGYKHGEKAINYFLSDKIKRLTTALSMFLLFMVGALAITFTNLEPEMASRHIFEFEMTDWLTRVFGPLAVVYLAYYLMVEKKIKQEYIILILSVIVVVGAVGVSLFLPAV